jgi:uncharacterized protein (DUF58 family)
MIANPSALQVQAEALGARLPPLLVAADRVAATISQGVHGRRRKGPGDTFWEFRRYEFGDPATSVDWRQSAKRQALFVRENEWAAAQSVWLWCDHSPTMHFASAETLPPKSERALLLQLALMSLLVRGGERFALLGEGSLPATGRTTLNRLALLAMRDTARADALPPYMPLPRYGHLVIISDFLSPLDAIKQRLGLFVGRGVRGHLVQVLDPVEELFPFQGRIRFSGAQGAADAADALTFGRVEGLRESYRARLAAHVDGLAALALAAGWSFTRHRTDKPPETALLTLYMAMSEVMEAYR